MENLSKQFIDDPQALAAYYEDLFHRIQEAQDLNIFTHYDQAQVEKRLADLAQKENPGRLYGIPFTLKDNMAVQGQIMSCGSRMLANYEAVYDSTVAQRILAEDGVILGLVNMDEFACGGSSETSYFGPTKNPLDPERNPGGSSSGSAASVAAGLARISLGSDTGGSIRQPATYCNVIGFMPSYGSISRYGVASMAHTLDNVSLAARRVDDIIDAFNVLAGYDEKDMTTTDQAHLPVEKKALDPSQLTIGVLDLDGFGLEDQVRQDYELGLAQLRDLGCRIQPLDLAYYHHGSAVYQVISTSEVSSCLARYDGVRYGYAVKDYEEVEELYKESRSQAFGPELQRRMVIGAYYTLTQLDQEFYQKATRVRRLISEELYRVLDQVDFIFTPTTTDLPKKFGESDDDVMAAFHSGAFNVPANLAGLPAISLPVRPGISGSVQFMGQRHDDQRLLQVAKAWEER